MPYDAVSAEDACCVTLQYALALVDAAADATVIVPDMAGFALLRGLARDDVLRELDFSGRVVDGTEAVAIGLATRLCDDPLAEASAVVQCMAVLRPGAGLAGLEKRAAIRRLRVEATCANIGNA